MRGDEVYVLYSATKLFTMVAGMQLIERGAVRLDDPVSKYLPEYANLTVLDGGEVRPARTVMTVEHLMTMQGGLDYDTDSEPIRACLAKYGQAATTRQLGGGVRAKAAAVRSGNALPLQPLPRRDGSGDRGGVGAAVWRIPPKERHRAARHALHGFFAQRGTAFAHGFALPLGRAGAPPVEEARTGNFCRISEAHESGGGGLMGDVDSYILLPEALANDGVGRSGARILTRRVHRRDAQKPPDGRFAARLRRALREERGYGYGLGVRTLTDPATYSRALRGSSAGTARRAHGR